MEHAAAGAGAIAENRDRTAERFALLYRELLPPVYGYVRFRVGDRHLAEDLTAEVFARALPRLASEREPERVRAWLFGIARHVVADARRAARSSEPAVALEAADVGLPSGHGTDRVQAESPEWEVVRRDEVRRLVAGLSDLDERSRDVIGLRYVAGLRHREIGRALGLSENNVAQILHRALAALRRRLQDETTPRRVAGGRVPKEERR